MLSVAYNCMCRACLRLFPFEKESAHVPMGFGG